MGEKPAADAVTDKEERRRLRAERKAKKEAKKAAKKEEKRKRKRDDHDSDGDANIVRGDDDEYSENNEAPNSTKKNDKKKKEKKKEKKSKAKQLSKEERRKEREQKKAAKKAEMASLLEQVPLTDEDGIAYTKIQIRRMTRRVKRGLPPVPTEEEERERRRQDKIERELEERELADMLHTSTKRENADDKGDADSDDDGEDEDGNGDSDGKDDEDDAAMDEEDEGQKQKATPTPQRPPSKKSKRSKPVPHDYVCQACSNKHQPAHWIYDCPNKVTVRGTNQVAKKLRGINEPDSRKVFVSGLPFEIKARDVEKYFQDACGRVVHCKLLTFDDTKRCKGQGFLTFETDEAAKKAIKMSGNVLDYEPAEKKKKKKKGQTEGSTSSKKKELVLKVTKVKSRIATGGRKF
mmetsp:Transcript_17633/g.38560  ORF Transcript_17633/g.38560 Transcript_17633/m.38560 type:complete len:406 (+) Transcript_17633:101-1318(+)